MLYDAHTHFFSRRFFEFFAEQAQVPLGTVAALTGADVPGDDPGELADRWVEELDRRGVDRAVTIASVPGDEGSVLAAVRRHPDRLSGYFLVDPGAADAVERVRRGLAEGLKGVCLFPAMHHFYPDDEALAPLFAAVEQAGGVAFVHCGLLSVPIRDKLGLPPAVELKYSHPLRLHGVANRHPRLPLVVPHFGCGFFAETLMLGRQTANVYLDTSSSNGWIDLSPGLDLRTVFAHALRSFGPGRLLFGTDSSSFPRGWRHEIYDLQREIVAGLGLRAADREGIFGGNLARLLGG